MCQNYPKHNKLIDRLLRYGTGDAFQNMRHYGTGWLTQGAPCCRPQEASPGSTRLDFSKTENQNCFVEEWCIWPTLTRTRTYPPVTRSKEPEYRSRSVTLSLTVHIAEES